MADGGLFGRILGKLRRPTTTIGACLCFKDSASFLEEWLLFHYVQGVRRFYLYDNGSSDHWREVVEPWEREGLAVAQSFPGLGVQGEIYDHCLARARSEVEWLAFLDDDEFLYPAGQESLAEILAEFRDCAGLAVAWVLYGSGGIEAREEGWVVERFTMSAGAADPHPKCIVQPRRVTRSHIIGHSFVPTRGREVVDENRRRLDPDEARLHEPSVRRLRINHYLVKSWEEWTERRSRPQADTGKPTPHDQSVWREWDRAWSQAEDRSAQRFVPAMRELQAQLRAGAPINRGGRE